MRIRRYGIFHGAHEWNKKMTYFRWTNQRSYRVNQVMSFHMTLAEMFTFLNFFFLQLIMVEYSYQLFFVYGGNLSVKSSQWPSKLKKCNGTIHKVYGSLEATQSRVEVCSFLNLVSLPSFQISGNFLNFLLKIIFLLKLLNP